MPADFEVLPADPQARAEMWRDHCRTLVAPLDDMWAAFAEQADAFAMRWDGELIGFFSVNEHAELHCFHLRAALEHRAEACFERVLASESIAAALPATVDPAFLSLSIDHARSVEVKALLFQHVAAPEVGESLPRMRTAGEADFEASVAFDRAATAAPSSFLRPYLAARIEAGELLLHEAEGTIVGVGELRRDPRHPGCAHLGVVVGEASRGRGMGSAILRFLVEEAGRRHLRPTCSTEPGNAAARRIIERAGFRARHRVLRVGFGAASGT